MAENQAKKRKTTAKQTPKLEKKFIQTIEGRDFVLYAGLLDLATQIGLSKMEVELVKEPDSNNGNTAICKATAITSDGKVFTDFGDANPQNCNYKVAKHLIRMASTRAKARCLRDLTNVGMTALEELTDYSEVIGAETKTEPVKPAASTSKSAKKSETNKKETNKKETKSPPEISQTQKKAILNLAKRRNIETETLEEMSLKQFDKSISKLSAKEAASFIHDLQKAA
ncbi:hypothetical protein ACFL7D_00840 [candidate division KSB1 bacterium]